jgi:hypothetical protein
MVFEMNRRFPPVMLTAALGVAMFLANGQPPPPSADPYANNPDAGKCGFRAKEIIIPS